MISGSLALNHYVMPRMTMDIDLVIELNSQNVQQFLGAFDESEYYLNQNTIAEEVSGFGMFNVIDLESGIKVDFIIRKDNKYRKLEFNRRVRKRIGESEVWMVTAEDLIISKLYWIQRMESEKQKTDIANLLKIETLDREYLKQWIEKLNLHTYGLFELL
jgi:hypothetical protein